MVTRIRELLEARQLSPTQFADLIGVGRPVISHILSERNKPSLEVVQKVISAFPEVSLPWLLSGVGTMLTTALPVAAQPTSASPALPPIISPPATAQAVPTLARPAIQQAPPPLARPLPPKFRPAAQVSARPLPDAAAVQATEPIAAADLAAAPALPTPAPVAQPVAPTELPPAPLEPVLAGPPILSPANLTSPPSPGSPAPVPEGIAVAPTTTPTERLPAEPTNSAAALSFLGEPGKAIRRIVIFYRDGSFSDYVPEGQ